MNDQPLTADGVPFTPGMTLWTETDMEVATLTGAELHRVNHRGTGGLHAWICDRGTIALSVAYSTRAAALRARADRLRRELAELERSKQAKLAELIEAEMAARSEC